MRSAVFVALLVSTAALLAGCSGKGDGDDVHVTCPDGKEIHSEDYANVTTTPDLLSKCSGAGGSKTNTTTQAPNKMPVLVLTVSDDGGNTTNVTSLDGNLTFDATGSADPDGSVTGIAVTVQDSNTTRTASLYDPAKKQFKSATFRFDRAGPVNVTVAMVDDRAGFTVNQTKVFVNHPQVLGSHTFPVGDASGQGAFDEGCKGFAEENMGDVQQATDALVYKPFTLAVNPGATFIEVTRTSGDAQMTICAPDGTAVSTPSEEATVTSDQPLPPAMGADSYYVAVYSTTGPQNEVALSAVVHYEPQAAPAA